MTEDSAARDEDGQGAEASSEDKHGDAPLGRLFVGDNLEMLAHVPDASCRLIYIDPPFNTGKRQVGGRIKVKRGDPASQSTSRRGFAGKHYEVTEAQPGASYEDAREDFIPWLVRRVRASLRCATADASYFVHVDTHESHYVKVALDEVFGRDCFQNEIIWAYDFGGRSKRRWPKKHDTILWYSRDPKNYYFDYDAMDRIPYMAPGLVSKEKAARGKTPTDVWWHTIVPTNGKERTGYPTQKPLGVLRRIVRVHSAPGDRVLDFFAGSGTTGEAALLEGRRFVLIDESDEAAAVIRTRLGDALA